MDEDEAKFFNCFVLIPFIPFIPVKTCTEYGRIRPYSVRDFFFVAIHKWRDGNAMHHD